MLVLSPVPACTRSRAGKPRHGCGVNQAALQPLWLLAADGRAGAQAVLCTGVGTLT